MTNTEQPGPHQQDVGLEQPHRAARSDLPGFVQVGHRARHARPSARQKTLPGAGEEAEGEIGQVAGAAEAGHDLGDLSLNI